MKDLHATGALLALMVATFAPGVKTVHITLTVANFDDGAFRHAASCAPRLYTPAAWREEGFSLRRCSKEEGEGGVSAQYFTVL